MTRHVGRPLKEFTVLYPSRRLAFEMRFDRAKDPIGVEFVASLEEIAEPFLTGKLIIIDESNEITLCVCQCVIAGESNVLARLNAVGDPQFAIGRTTGHRIFR